MENPLESEDQLSPVPETPTQLKQRFKLSTLEILFGSLILLGLLYVGYFIFFQESGGTAAKLEKKVKAVETGLKEKVDSLDKNVKQFQSQQAQMEARLKALENTNRDLLAKISKFEKHPGEERKTTPGKEKRQVYKVKKGETLRSIAKKFRISPEELARWNKVDKNKTVRPGETLVILSH